MKLRTQLFAGYFLVLGLIIAIATVSYFGSQASLESARWVTHTQEAISNGHLIEKLLSDMETGQRGFLLTGDENFLAPYESGREQYSSTIDELNQHVQDNPAQVHRLEMVDKLVRKWQRIAAAPEIAERRNVRQNAVDADHLQTVLKKGVGKSILDEIRQISAVMEKNFRIDGNLKGEILTNAFAKSIVDCETGQRGFLLTGDKEFLEPFDFGIRQVDSSVAALRALVSNAHDRLRTFKDIETLKSLSQAWHTQAGDREISIRREIDLGRREHRDLESILSLGTGKKLLDEIRVVLSGLDEMFRIAENGEARTLVSFVSKAIVDQETGQRGFLITGKEEFLEPFLSGQKDFDASIESLRQLNSRAYDIAIMKRDIQKLEWLASEWIAKAANPEIELRNHMNESTSSIKTVAQMISSKKGKAIMDEFRSEIAKFIQTEKGLLAARILKAENATAYSTFVVFFGTLFAILLGASAMMYTTRKIQHQVGGEPSEIAAITEQIANGDLDLEIGGDKNRTGIFQSVGTMVVALRKAKSHSAEQDWYKSGQNQLNELMRGECSIEEIADNIIRFLAKYLNAQTGALYVPERDTIENDIAGDSLWLAGSYAFTKIPGVNDRIELGQGIVGQAAASRELICVDQLPDDYSRISSATGEARPKNVFVLPLVFDEKLHGVVELGGFSDFSPRTSEFLTYISDAVSIAINSTKTRLQVIESLEKTTQQADELKTQQKMLKGANEALEQKTAFLQEQKLRVEIANEKLVIARAEIEEKASELERRVEERTLELQDAFKSAQAASQSKSDFLANMSHEIRTPMTAILGFTEIVRDHVTEAEPKEWLGKIQRNGHHLLGIINDILDISKIESNKMTVETIDVSPAQILSDVASLMNVRADGKGISLAVEFDGPIPERIKSDPTRLRQILVNLTGNAIKFSEVGEVKMVARILNPNSTHPLLEVDVIDSGIGMTEDQLAKLFQPFVQADSSTTRRFGGTGLGLTISKRLSEMLGGGISVQSSFGTGSTFSVTIATGELNGIKMIDDPTDVSNDEDTKEPTYDDTQLVSNVLLAEDGPDNQRLISFVLEKAGATVTVAQNGKIALDLALAARDENNPFDVILMDMQMPVLGGYDAARQLREAEYKGPIIALTAHAMAEDKAKCIDAGCDDYATKPINRKQLISLVSQYSQKQKNQIPTT